MSILPQLSRETYEDYNFDPGLFTTDVSLSDYFTIGKAIGKGESAIVFEATFLPTKEKVAIKYFPNYLPLRKAILRELTVLKISGNCRYLIKYHSHFRLGAKCYIVTEACSGVNFNDFLNPHLSMPVALVRIYMKQLAQAIIFLHEHQIIHRDISLKNLVLDKKGNLRLVDYGLSRTVNDSMGMMFTDWGTLRYAAPEVYKDKMCSYPVDWWSCGVVLYRFITGGFPFQTTNRRTASYQIVKTHVVVYPPEFFNDIKLASLTQGLLEKNPHKRLGSVDQREIMTHPFFEKDDWEKFDDVRNTILDSDQDDLLWYKDTYKNMMMVLGDVIEGENTSKHVKRWSQIEGLLYKSRDYGPRASSMALSTTKV